jgi:alkylation response protein AidB-like acyl-CoA dehydrogenase
VGIQFEPEEQRFRELAREWLSSNAPKTPRPLDGPDMLSFDVTWQRRQHEAGWAGISWPEAYGGRGLTTLQQLIWYEEYARADAPFIGANFVGVNHAGPTLIALGSPAQRDAHLKQILQGAAIWCQGFSEPGAGSDLASLRTRGEVDGDHLVVSGQKIWTSFGHMAQYQELLVRTGPSDSRHKGLTWVICDMHAPGIDIRPIREMSGEEHFCEVFYDEVRIPLSSVVGNINAGWQVAMATLAFERGTAFLADQVGLARQVESLIAFATETTGQTGRPLIGDDEVRRSLAMLRAEVTALRSMAYAVVSKAARSGMPGPEGSLVKLYVSQLSQTLHKLTVKLMGSQSLVFGYGSIGPVCEYLRSYAASIAGGTSAIQREIIADRFLSLPRSR